ncbi:tetratricopeptide repeat protein [Sneathiella glossodoripedis]|uniref:tetratricopeptide repeat protein n=1 Tax=Sneathiella glossodoripedis TaxID=418853 RepID=UPI0006856284|nr:tetratricopeptide repeat protein [Sneathiella glossodoripedis]
MVTLLSEAPVQAEAAKDAYLNGDHAKAFTLWQRAAHAGEAEAQFNLAYMYENAQGTKRDLFAAAKWYELAAGQNYPMSQQMLSNVLRKIDRESQKALLKWLPKAEAGDPNAQLAVSQVLVSKELTSRDDVEALKWLLLAEAGTKNSTTYKRIIRLKEKLISMLDTQQVSDAKDRVENWKKLRETIR